MHLLLTLLLGLSPVPPDPPVGPPPMPLVHPQRVWVQVPPDTHAGFVAARAPGAALAAATFLDLGAHGGSVWSEDALERVLRDPAMAGVLGLRLSDTRLSAVPFKALASSGSLGGLERLELARCHMGQTGARALGFARGLDGLRHLDVSGNPLDPMGLQGLLQGAWVPQLQGLDLRDTGLAADVVGQAVLGAGFGPSMERLRLDSTGLSPALRARLLERFGEALDLDTGSEQAGEDGAP